MGLQMALSQKTLDRAEELANAYNWPFAARHLAKGIVPEGFGREVGQAIVLFKQRWPFYFMAYRNAAEDDEHAKRLGELRLLVAKIGIAQRAATE